MAAEVCLTGDIEGRIIFDVDQKTATAFASHLAGAELPETDELVREAVCELANQIIGNAVTVLNDQGFHFRVHPPTLHTSEQGSKSSEDTEALVMCFSTESGNVFMNVALRYHRRRALERVAAYCRRSSSGFVPFLTLSNSSIRFPRLPGGEVPHCPVILILLCISQPRFLLRAGNQEDGILRGILGTWRNRWTALKGARRFRRRYQSWY